jgi:hypothetical protein
MSNWLGTTQTLRPAFLPIPDHSIAKLKMRWWIYKAGFARVRKWPRGRFMAGDVSADPYMAGLAEFDGDGFKPSVTAGYGRGGGGALKIRGVTRDDTGAPLSSCTVQCFRTSDDLLVSECVSGGEGYFEAPSQYPGVNHYLVCYKGSGPDVAGTSVNTLQPS